MEGESELYIIHIFGIVFSPLAPIISYEIIDASGEDNMLKNCFYGNRQQSDDQVDFLNF